MNRSIAEGSILYPKRAPDRDELPAHMPGLVELGAKPPHPITLSKELMEVKRRASTGPAHINYIQLI